VVPLGRKRHVGEIAHQPWTCRRYRPANSIIGLFYAEWAPDGRQMVELRAK
jgi:hypothetical protein